MPPQPLRQQALFGAVLAGLLGRVGDGNSRVQEAAVSGLAELLEHAGHTTRGAVLLPHLQVRGAARHACCHARLRCVLRARCCLRACVTPARALTRTPVPATAAALPLLLPVAAAAAHALLQPLVDTLSRAIGSCGRRNLRIVLDALTTFCDVVGGRTLAQHPAAVQSLLMPLFARWQAPGLSEREAVTIMEALTGVALSLGPGFEPYAPAVFEKAVGLLAAQQEARAAQVRRAHACAHARPAACCCAL